MRSAILPTSALVGISALAIAGGCGAGSTPLDEQGGAVRTAEILFVLESIPDSVVRVDLSVTGPEMDPVNGTLEVAAGEASIRLTIPVGPDRNVFARGFSEEKLITHIGEANFQVVDQGSMTVSVPLNFKGEHLPDP